MSAKTPRSGFGGYLRRHRLRQSWSQGRLAQEIGVTSTYIHLLEKGRVDAPTDRRAEQLAQALGLPVDEVRDLARKERLEHYVAKQGWQPEDAPTAGSPIRGGDLTPDERALIELFRGLDDEARGHLESTLYLLLRDRVEPEIAVNLERLAGSRGR